jgi:glyoxylase-like metal-dependent hydrolase (beta-lactamase superfamily II)
MDAMEIAPYTWRLASLLGNRNVFQYVISGEGGETVLIDTGTSDTPREVIMPALRHLGLRPSRVATVIVTHPDADHQGGLAALQETLPAARFMCGFEDVGLVSSPDRLLEERYGAYRPLHGMGYSASELSELRSICGGAATINFGLVGGERLDLGGRSLTVLHAPGHSAGHLVVHEPASGLLFSSDAIHGRMIPAADGTPALPPTYEDVDAYLSTVDMIAGLGPTELHSGHWPALTGEDIQGWLGESRSFVGTVDEVIRGWAVEPVSLRELCQEVEGRLGPFGADSVNLMFIVHGHLRRLLRTGAAEVDLGQSPPRFALAPNR